MRQTGKRTNRPVPDIWAYLVDPEKPVLSLDADALRAAASQLAALIGPALAGFLLAPVSERLGAPLLDPDAVSRDRLLNIFVLAQKRRWAACIVDAGIEVVFLKGFANAYTLYTDPPSRAQGDLDILVHDHDLSRTVSFLSAQGFRFRPLPVSPWGMISEASFMPMVSADGACHIDIHVHPDCYPAYRSLTTTRAFADARTVEAGEFRFKSPSLEHTLVLCVTNAAKDKFCVPSLTKVVDAIFLLRDNAAGLDWDSIAALAREGAFLRPMVTFFGLLSALGMPMENVPAALRVRPRGLRRIVFRSVVDDYRALFPRDVSLASFLWREWLIGAEPGVAFRNLVTRLKGIIRPSAGIPEGGPVESGDMVLPDPSGVGVRADSRGLGRHMRSCIQE